MYWLFYKVFDAPYAKWPSLDSCKMQGQGLKGHRLTWKEAPNGPQGNGLHFYAYDEQGKIDDDILIVEVQND